MIKKIIMNKNFEKQKIILENFYRCRDLELNNLWQKSVFLGSFLILGFTGYGGILFSMVKENNEVLLKYNASCLLVCFVSAMFSLLWIYMFKGSKVHYEIYERAIRDLEESMLEEKEKNVFGKEGTSQKSKSFVMGKLDKSKISIDESFLSTNGGGFSPSRINIAIGQLCLALSLMGFIFHFCYIFGYIFSFDIISWLFGIRENETLKWYVFILIIVLLLLLLFYKIKRIKSTSI